jgi:uncharacterized protein (DUF1330 family)
MIAGVALGATAIQGLHAQAKKVYFISHSEVVNPAAVEEWNKTVRPLITKFGGNLMISDKIVSVLGTAPQRIGLTEFPSIEKAKAWADSKERADLDPQRSKAIKLTNQYIVEVQ